MNLLTTKRYSFLNVMLLVLVAGGISIAVARAHHTSEVNRLYHQHRLNDVDGVARIAQKAYQKIVANRNAAISPTDQAKFTKAFFDSEVSHHTWWMGVRLLQNPCDMWMLQQIIYETRPHYIVETGTYHGGSALYCAQVLEGMGLENSRVITVDIEPLCEEASKHPLWKKHVEFILGSSTDPHVIARICKTVAGKKVMVLLDSDHSRHHVLEELHCFSPLVSPGCYLVVEDTALDGVPLMPDAGPGPMAAIQEFLRTDDGKHFVQDASREAFMLTYFPGGWLKKIDPPTGNKSLASATNTNPKPPCRSR